MRNVILGVSWLLLIPSTVLAGVPTAPGASPAPAQASPHDDVGLPAFAFEPVRLRSRDDEIAIWFRLQNATESQGEDLDGSRLYREGVAIGDDNFDFVLRPIPGGVEDFVLLHRRPTLEAISYDFDVTDVAGLRLVANTLELLDSQGAPRLRVRAPYLVDALGTRRTARLEVYGCDVDVSPVAPWGRAVVPPGNHLCQLVVRWGAQIGQGIAYPAVLDPAWVDASLLAVPRNAHASANLPDGRVLIAGGYLSLQSSTYTAMAEIFDPDTQTWAATGAMARGRAHYNAVTFTSGSQAGKALFAAGDDQLQPTAEIYDPTNGSWTLTAPMNVGRDGAETVLLSDGRVLTAGGCSAYSSTCTRLESSAEIYDPETDTWTPAANTMSVPRALFTLSQLGDGTAIAAGGCTAYSPGFACYTTTPSADIFDPATDSFASAALMPAAHQNHVAATLASGEVIVAAGTANGTLQHASATYDPTTGRWTARGSTVADHDEATITALPTGGALLAGSWGTSVDWNQVTATTEVYDPMSGTWALDVTMLEPHGQHTANLLADGRVLVAGGFNQGPNFTLEESGTSEIWDPAEPGEGGGGGASTSTTAGSTTAGVTTGGSTTAAATSSSSGGGGSGGETTDDGDEGCGCKVTGGTTRAPSAQGIIALLGMALIGLRRRGRA